MADLVLPLKAVYFEEIRQGTKVEEFRERTPYWRRRLEGRTFDRVVLTNGYPKAGDDSRRLVREWRGFRETTITHPHFGDKPVEVFAIDVATPMTSAKPWGYAVGGNHRDVWYGRWVREFAASEQEKELGKALYEAAPDLSADTLYLIRRLLANRYQFSHGEFAAELERIVSAGQNMEGIESKGGTQ